MGMNMKEFVTIKKLNKGTLLAEEMRKWKQQEICEKNLKQRVEYEKKKQVLNKVDR
jgi:hypothetical protein